MTALLEKAMAEVSKLPSKEQDTFAQWILDELADEERWDQAFAKSQDALAKLAQEARAEYRAGKTIPLDLEQL